MSNDWREQGYPDAFTAFMDQKLKNEEQSSMSNDHTEAFDDAQGAGSSPQDQPERPASPAHNDHTGAAERSHKYPWPEGPYRPLTSQFERRTGVDVGASVQFAYPVEQYVAFDTNRSNAQSKMMCLGPEMAAEFLRMADEWDMFWKRPPTRDNAQYSWYEIAERLRMIMKEHTT